MSSSGDNKRKSKSKKSIHDVIQKSESKEGSHASPRLHKAYNSTKGVPLKKAGDERGSPDNNQVVSAL